MPTGRQLNKKSEQISSFCVVQKLRQTPTRLSRRDMTFEVVTPGAGGHSPTLRLFSHLGVSPRDLNEAATSRRLCLVSPPPSLLFVMTFTKSYKHTWVRTGRREKKREESGQKLRAAQGDYDLSTSFHFVIFFFYFYEHSRVDEG